MEYGAGVDKVLLDRAQKGVAVSCRGQGMEVGRPALGMVNTPGSAAVAEHVDQMVHWAHNLAAGGNMRNHSAGLGKIEKHQGKEDGTAQIHRRKEFHTAFSDKAPGTFDGSRLHHPEALGECHRSVGT